MKRFILLLVVVAVCGNRSSSSSDENSGEPDEPVIIDIDDLKRHDYSKNLMENGVWANWDTGRKNVPDNAVYGGHDRNGASYVIMADHTTSSGSHLGKVPGKYFPLDRYAYVVAEGKEHRKTQFEILLHNGYAWGDIDEPRQMIPGSGYYICRILNNNGDVITPGRLSSDKRLCSVGYENKIQTSTNFEVLRRGC